MAQSIPLKVAQRPAREELRAGLAQPSEHHAEAVLAAYELLQAMHDQGLLEIARGMLNARDEILGTLAATASTPEATRAIRNLLFWRHILGSMEPGCFRGIFQAIPEGIALATAEREKPVPLFSLLRRMTNKDSLRAVAAAVDLLQSFGWHLMTAESPLPRPETQR